MPEKNLRIGIFTVPLESASVLPLSNLIEILFSISDSFVVITGNEGYNKFKKERRFKVYGINYKIGNPFLRIVRGFCGQIKASLIILKLPKKIDTWIFYEGEYAIIPVIIASLLKKRVIILLLGSTVFNLSLAQDPLVNIVRITSKINLKLADNIIIYSPTLIEDWNLQQYAHKILIAREHFLDLNTFKIIVSLSDRPYLIGYIGRLSEEKGVQNFVQALPALLRDQKDLRVLVGGDGQLKESIKASLQAEKLTGYMDFPGWISHDDLPYYLNQLRLLILPSYAEGLPNIMLEAMACGTPVLVTPVGAIPDFIRDSETGFIMKNNSPECIAENIMRALNSPNLEKIASNGRRFVEENFTFEKTVERWNDIF
ncbi:MAG: glycosyltransferase family 4 protein [Methanoregula sp.]|jgi:glycosyltransferase involved in cell wall biosynthesis|uniref:glycosyltransferase family 4 protein n=1 Tax=Methanoregula sp. TaxID=2052170 RepID=UPI003C1746F0